MREKGVRTWRRQQAIARRWDTRLKSHCGEVPMGLSGGPQATERFPWTAVARARLGRLGCTAQHTECSAGMHEFQMHCRRRDWGDRRPRVRVSIVARGAETADI